MPINRTISRPARRPPFGVPGLLCDWNPAVLSLTDGDAISYLPDTWNGYHSVATGTARATFKTNVRNGKPCARFDGTNDNASSASLSLANTQAITIVAVMSAASSGDQVLIEFGTNYNSFTDAWLVYRTTNNFIEGALKGNVGINNFVSARTVTTRPEVVSVTLDTSNAQSPPNGSATAYRESNVFIGGLQSQGSNGWVNSNNNTNVYGNRAINIGARNASSLRLNGDVYRILLYGRALSHVERRHIERELTAYYDLRRANGVLAFIGDSLTAGTGTTNPYPNQVMASITGDYNWGNFGMNGWTLLNMMESGMFDRVLPYATFEGRSVAVLWGGTNDMCSPGSNQSAATTWTRYQAAAGLLRTAGFHKVGILNCLPRSDAAAPADFLTKRGTLNSSIASGWSAVADFIVDVAAISGIGADGDSDVTTNYQADKVHLNATGLGLVAAAVETAIESL